MDPERTRRLRLWSPEPPSDLDAGCDRCRSRGVLALRRFKRFAVGVLHGERAVSFALNTELLGIHMADGSPSTGTPLPLHTSLGVHHAEELLDRLGESRYEAAAAPEFPCETIRVSKDEH